MAKAIRVRRCYNCGEVLQSDNPKFSGYISKEIIDNNKPDALLYCNRCYNKIKALNSSEIESNINEDILKVLSDAVATDALIIWVVDLFNFNGELPQEITKKIRNLKLIVVGTKRDLFAKNIKDNVFQDYLKARFTSYGLEPVSYVILGHESKIDGDRAVAFVNQQRLGHDVYMIGSATCGKTSIINKVLKSYSNNSRWTICTEQYPGTEAKVLNIPLSNSSSFYELPGFALNDSVLSKVSKDVIKFITPKNKIAVTQKTLSAGDAVVIGNLAQYTLIKGKSTSFKFYSAEKVEYKKIRMEKSNEFFLENNQHRSNRPFAENLSTFNDYDLFEYKMEKDGKIHDIYVTGLCWASFVGKGQTIRIMLPKGVEVKECLGKFQKVE